MQCNNNSNAITATTQWGSVMKFSKQILLSAAMMVGGSVLLYATVHQILQNDDTPAVVQAPAMPTVNQAAVTANQPLTVDAATEQRLLVEKQRQREAQVAAQERAAQQYLNEQQRIEAEALARSRAENERYAQRAASNTNTPTSAPSSQPAHTTSYSNNTATSNPKVTATVVRPVVTPRPVEVVEVIEPSKLAKPTTQANLQASHVKTNPKPETQAPPPTRSKPATKPDPDPVAAKPTPKKPAEQLTAKTATKPETKNTIESTAASNTTRARADQHQVKAGEGLISLARRYDMPTSVLAAANDLPANGQLRVGQTLKIPSQAQVQRIKREAEQEQARKQREAEQKKQQREQFVAAQQKLRDARRNVKENDAKGNFGVQVALAADDERADAIAKELKAAGYKVKTSQTSRGVRVVVGPETGKEAALALKDKINADPRVDAKNGWVLYW